jgi:predicted anti-sigma-YlaC factor YlaD
MNKEYCEKVRISAMAISDGEQPILSELQIKEHIESCADCRLELEQQKYATELLDGQKRRSYDVDVWSGIETVIEQSAIRPKPRLQLWLFAALSLILFAYKIIEVLPVFTPGVIFKLMSLVVVFVFFVLLGQNPFIINQNLTLKGDIK